MYLLSPAPIPSATMASSNLTATEVRILSNFLLSRAGLKDIISRDKFIELFPKEKRTNPQVKLIYNELREGRHEQLELVRKNINMETKFGFERRQDESKKRKRDQMAGEEVMAEIEVRSPK
jgi:centromere-localized protein 2